MWIPLTGKLDKELVSRYKAVAVRYNNDKTDIKETTKDMLWQYDLSTIIKEVRFL